MVLANVIRSQSRASTGGVQDGVSHCHRDATENTRWRPTRRRGQPVNRERGVQARSQPQNLCQQIAEEDHQMFYNDLTKPRADWNLVTNPKT